VRWTGDPCADRRLVKDPDGTKFAAQVFVAAEEHERLHRPEWNQLRRAAE